VKELVNFFFLLLFIFISLLIETGTSYLEISIEEINKLKKSRNGGKGTERRKDTEEGEGSCDQLRSCISASIENTNNHENR
jgi:hypothetical protein